MALTVLYPGSFDPITNGHTDLVVRASKICDHVILAVARDSTKKHLFTLEERVSLAKGALVDLPNVEVRSFEGLTAEYARQIGAKAILRGLRAVSDFEFEFQLASMNRNLAPDIETLFLTPAEHTSYVSSTLVREVARLGGDVTHFVAPHVVTALKARYNIE